MTIDFFSEFLTLADTRNFGVAAERHYIAIATLARHMRVLEEQFGTALFHRQGNKFLLTEAGKALIPYAQSVVAALDSYREAVASIRNQPNLNIKIVSTLPLSFYGITNWIEKFQREHCINRIDVRLAQIRQIEQGLLNEEYDFAIVWHLEHLPYRLAAIPLKKIEFAALMPASHRLAGSPSVPISDLKGEPLLLLDNMTAFYNQAVHLCWEAGFAPTIRATAHRGRSIEDLVSSGFGIGLMPIDTSTNLYEGLVRKPISPRCEMALDIIYYNSAEPSESARTLIQYLCAAFSEDDDTQPI